MAEINSIMGEVWRYWLDLYDLYGFQPIYSHHPIPVRVYGNHWFCPPVYGHARHRISIAHHQPQCVFTLLIYRISDIYLDPVRQL